MTLRIAVVVLGLALWANGADAAHWNDEKLPKPIDHPIVRPKLKEGHKVTPKLRYNNPYERVTWGSEWKKIFRTQSRGMPHYLR